MPSLSQLYRPKRFAEVTGQTHITETLKREVATGQLGHAYVFSGPRGVGKTTTARIFAQALNCVSPNDGEPCGSCANCKAFEEGRLVDVTEMDAATHTGVDNVRESIIEHVRFSPMSGKAKVYILDEAHKLSDGSWNALLKTLEEPPAYAFFILATTEWHKIPATIISRCQRFEFKRIAPDVLTTRIQDLAKQQGWRIEDEVIKMIVARSEGCLRDAETLLGQLGSLADTNITLDVASLVIPRSQKPMAVELMTFWGARDHAGAFACLQRAFDGGASCMTLCDELIDCVRQLLLATALSKQDLDGWKTDADPDHALLFPLAETFEPGELHDLALMLMDRRRDMKQGMDPLFAMQLASTMMANGYLKRSSRSWMDSRLRGNDRVEIRNDKAEIGNDKGEGRNDRGEKMDDKGGIGNNKVENRNDNGENDGNNKMEIRNNKVENRNDNGENDGNNKMEIRNNKVQNGSDQAEIGNDKGENEKKESVERGGHTEEAVIKQGVAIIPAKAGIQPSGENPLDLNRVRTMWSSIIQAVDDKNHSLPFILKISRPEEVREHTVVIRFQYPFHQDKIIKDVKHRRVVEGVMQELLGVSSITIEGIVGEDAERKEQREQDMVSNVLSVFGGTMAESSS